MASPLFKGCYRMEINSKVFAISILTASGLPISMVDVIEVRIEIPNAIEYQRNS